MASLWSTLLLIALNTSLLLCSDRPRNTPRIHWNTVHQRGYHPSLQERQVLAHCTAACRISRAVALSASQARQESLLLSSNSVGPRHQLT